MAFVGRLNCLQFFILIQREINTARPPLILLGIYALLAGALVSGAKKMDDEGSSRHCQEVTGITRKQERPVRITATEQFRDVCLNKTVLDDSLIQHGKSALADR